MRSERSTSAVLAVSVPRGRDAAGVRRVEVETGGGPVWFESPDTALEPSAEAFVCALLVPALERRVQLVLPAPLDPKFRARLDDLLRTFRAWWGYRKDGLDRLGAGPAPGTAPAEAVGSCFTGGVDSFHNLLVAGHRTDVLLFVHGFDIALDDEARFAHFHRSFVRVAEATGARPVVVRTNLRRHALAAGVSWERWHGGAVIAAGHACAGAIGSLWIPPSYRMDRLCPWGSDPRTDPLMSSSRLAVVHPPPREGRVERIAAIGAHPLVREHLRVCYENRTPTGNCSRCEKCVSTMAAFEGHGLLDGVSVFDRARPLEELIDALPYVKGQGLAVWREIAALDHRPAVRAALKRLLRRTPGPLKRTYWKVIDRWRRLTSRSA